MDESSLQTRQERRERKLKKKHEHMRTHGAGLAKIYRSAIEKRCKSTVNKAKNAGFRMK